MDPIFYQYKDIRCRIKVVRTTLFHKMHTHMRLQVKPGQIFMAETSGIGFDPSGKNRFCFYIPRKGYYSIDIRDCQIQAYPQMECWQKKHLTKLSVLMDKWLNNQRKRFPRWNGKEYR